MGRQGDRETHGHELIVLVLHATRPCPTLIPMTTSGCVSEGSACVHFPLGINDEQDEEVVFVIRPKWGGGWNAPAADDTENVKAVVVVLRTAVVLFIWGGGLLSPYRLFILRPEISA